MTTKTRPEPVIPPVAGVEAYEKPDWLPADTGLDWLNELRERHRAAVLEFALAVQEVGRIEDDTEAVQRAWRRAVRDAVSAGEPVPDKTFSLDISRAQREVAEEDVRASRDELSRVVVAVLAEVRRPQRRKELQGIALSAALARTINTGPEADTHAIRANLEAQLRRATEGEIVDLETADPALTRSESEEIADVS